MDYEECEHIDKNNIPTGLYSSYHIILALWNKTHFPNVHNSNHFTILRPSLVFDRVLTSMDSNIDKFFVDIITGKMGIPPPRIPNTEMSYQNNVNLSQKSVINIS